LLMPRETCCPFLSPKTNFYDALWPEIFRLFSH
jgi:hypothetical protein